MSHSEPDRQTMVSLIDKNWSQLVSKLESFSDDELQIPNVIGIWSLKDLIGHLETWDRIAVEKIRASNAGELQSWKEAVVSAAPDINEFNETDADENRHKAIAQLWIELHQRHAELVDHVQNSGNVNAELIAEDTWDHYRDHLNDIAVWEATRQEDNLRQSPS